MRIVTCSIIMLLIITSSELKAQRKKKDIKVTNISASINYNPPSNSYYGYGTYIINDNNILSGRESTRRRDDTTRIHLPTQRIALGFSYQVVKNNSSYKEFALNQLSYSESDKFKTLNYYFDNGEFIYSIPYGQTTNSFKISLRYEMGKYFSTKKSNNLNFGFGLGLQTGYRFYSDIPYINAFGPIDTHIIDLDLYGSFNIRKHIHKSIILELKLLPAISMQPYTRVRENTPLTQNRNGLVSDDTFPSIKTSGSLHLRYIIKDTSKRSRR